MFLKEIEMYEKQRAAQNNFQSADAITGGTLGSFSDCPVREPEIRAAMNGLQIETSDLAGFINILLDRLAPLLAPIPPGNEAGPKVSQPSSLFAQEIRGTQAAVADSRYRIQDILRRLEI
jgi:hypothetical protein